MYVYEKNLKNFRIIEIILRIEIAYEE